MTKPCDRYYGDGGAHTAKMINDEPCCTSCSQPLMEHKHAMGEHFHESNLIEGYDDPAFDKQQEYAWVYLNSVDRLTYDVICKVQKILTLKQDDLRPDQRGYTRSASKVGVTVGGRTTPSWWMVDLLLDNWLLDYKNLSPKAAHISFEKIHPFVDGNGRTGRLLMWWHEIQVGSKPTLIRKAGVSSYCDWFK